MNTHGTLHSVQLMKLNLLKLGLRSLLSNFCLLPKQRNTIQMFSLNSIFDYLRQSHTTLIYKCHYFFVKKKLCSCMCHCYGNYFKLFLLLVFHCFLFNRETVLSGLNIQRWCNFFVFMFGVF